MGKTNRANRNIATPERSYTWAVRFSIKYGYTITDRKENECIYCEKTSQHLNIPGKIKIKFDAITNEITTQLYHEGREKETSMKRKALSWAVLRSIFQYPRLHTGEHHTAIYMGQTIIN